MCSRWSSHLGRFDSILLPRNVGPKFSIDRIALRTCWICHVRVCEEELCKRFTLQAAFSTLHQVLFHEDTTETEVRGAPAVVSRHGASVLSWTRPYLSMIGKFCMTVTGRHDYRMIGKMYGRTTDFFVGGLKSLLDAD